MKTETYGQKKRKTVQQSNRTAEQNRTEPELIKTEDLEEL